MDRIFLVLIHLDYALLVRASLIRTHPGGAVGITPVARLLRGGHLL
jgi:hypothetical protein